MIMKKTFTYCIIVMMALLTTATPVKAQNAEREKINTIMMDLLNTWDHQSFQNAVALISKVTEYDMTNIAIEGITRLVGMKQVIEGGTDYRLLFSGHTFTGHFAVEDGKWVKVTDADDLQFEYTSPAGVPCVLRLATSGNVKTTNFPIDINELIGGSDDDDIDLSRGARIEIDPSMMQYASAFLKGFLQDVTMMTFEIPENTVVELTYGGQKLMGTDIKVDLSSIGDLLINGLVLSANTQFYKGVLDGSTPGSFELNLTNTGYKPGTGINADFEIKKDNTQLVSFKVSAPGTFQGLDIESIMGGGDIDLGFTSLNVDINVMGRAQLKGGIADLNSFIAMAAATDEVEPENAAAALEALNQMINVNLYFDVSSTPAAKLKLLPSTNTEDEEMEVEPYIVFASDNSQYTLEQFFSVENFPQVAEAVMGIVGEVGSLVEIARDTAKENIQKVNTVNSQPMSTATEWYTVDGRRTTATAKGLKICA